MLIKKSTQNVFFSRMRRSVTAKSIPTKFCTSTSWGDVVIYLTWNRNRLRGLGRVGCENGPLPLTLALACNTAYCATAHTRDIYWVDNKSDNIVTPRSRCVHYQHLLICHDQFLVRCICPLRQITASHLPNLLLNQGQFVVLVHQGHFHHQVNYYIICWGNSGIVTSAGW